jgi:putative membrane protein
MMWWWGHPYGHGFGVAMVVIMVIVWGAIIALTIWGIRRLNRHSPCKTSSNALDIARERYAKGEITKEQFEEIKKGLS